jgi:mannose-6-phosphate isomerase-like protein (cupin superfamily)
LRARLVRYAELRPCTNAFIDTRSPGSNQKENFTIIGPGVAENPHQFVHIREPHGFNIGGARQPPRCTNSIHSHNSEEVFIVLSGTWRFVWGEFGTAGEVVLRPGDTISIPIHVFRGFENVGEDTGFMFAVLGGDDPGRVHWAPNVIEKARDFGLVLLDNGTLVDTTLGEVVPAGARTVAPSSREELAYIREPSLAEMARSVVRHDGRIANPASQLASPGVLESAVIGPRVTTDGFAAGPISTSHGFTLRHLALSAGAKTPMHARNCVEVLLVHAGEVLWRNDAGESDSLGPGDTFTVPVGMRRQVEAVTPAELFVVRGGGDPGAAEISS